MPLKLRDIFNDDLDNVFSYRTGRYVIIRDIWLGCTYKLLQISILVYVILYALVLNEGYIKKEYSIGTTLMVKEGSQLVKGSNNTGTFSQFIKIELLADQNLVMYPIYDPNGFFFTTKMSVIRGQEEGKCKSINICSKNEDCNKQLEGECRTGVCFERNWCSQQNQTIETFKFDSKQFRVQFKSSISFPVLDKKVQYTSINQKKPIYFPDDHATSYSIDDILSLLPKSDQFNYNKIEEEGAIIHVSFTWECDVGQDCKPFLSVKRVDLHEKYVTDKTNNRKIKQNVTMGYNSSQYQYYRESKSGPLKRTEYNNVGIKFIVETKGIGKKIAVDSIILQISLGVALLKIGTIFVDFLMLYIFPNKKLYAREKYLKTEDFSQIQDILKKEEEEKLKKKQQREEELKKNEFSEESEGMY